MRHITWYRLLAVAVVGVLLLSIAGRAQAPQAQAPEAKVRELATIEGDVSGFVRLPSGRALIYTATDSGDRFCLPQVGDSTFTYDIARKRRTLLGTNMLPMSVSPLGDRLAFGRSSEDGTENFVWTMPIDPKTGIATGQAQRVSLRPTGPGCAVFSPDGKMLAFPTGPRPDGTWDVTLVPATGGPERVMANYPRTVRHGWSADGKSLYVELRDDARTAVGRVPVARGPSEPLFPRTLMTNHQVVGLSPDERVAFILAAPDRFFYRTASGVEGEISVALPPLENGGGISLTLDSDSRYATMTQVRNQRVSVLNLVTGQASDLLPGNVQSSTPAWSPDGRRIAVLTGNRSHYDITVVNADGSSPRRYAVPPLLDGWSGSAETPWSPDGRFLAFRARVAANGPQKVASSPDDQAQLALLDLDSGRTRVLTTSSARISSFVWRSDGKAIRTFRSSVVRPGSLPRRRIVEVDVDGSERELWDLRVEYSDYSSAWISDRLLLFGRGTAGSRFVIPASGGSAQRLPGETGGRWYLGASRDAKWPPVARSAERWP